MCKVINSEDKNNSLFSSEIVILADQYASTCEILWEFLPLYPRSGAKSLDDDDDDDDGGDNNDDNCDA